MPVGSVSAAPAPLAVYANYSVAGPSGFLIQSYAAAAAAGATLALPPAPSAGLPMLPKPPAVPRIQAAAAYGRLDVYA